MTLMNKIKSIIKKTVNECFINLLNIIKFKFEEFVLNIDVKLNDLIKIMKKWRWILIISLIAIF